MNKKHSEDYEIIHMSNDIYSNSNRNIYSNSFEDISSSSQPTKKSKRKKRRRKHIFLKLIAALLSILIIIGICFYSYTYKLIDSIERTPLDQSDLGINSSTYDSVKNIALFGLDTREDDKTGRADANVILTIDKKHKKIKLTSIARDSYVSIENHSKDKLTHAYAFGKSQLAVKTLNQNFSLEITDYVTVNFFELARIIDYIGGVTVDVSEAEFKELNFAIIPSTDYGDKKCDLLKAPGIQKLSGTQAVSYSRIRYADSDIERGNRQKEVITAMFTELKSINPFNLPKLANLICEECETSLSTNDIIALGLWAVSSSPEFEQISLPNDNIEAQGKKIGGIWYYVYDLQAAKKEIYDFIFEENYYSPEQKAQRESE